MKNSYDGTFLTDSSGPPIGIQELQEPSGIPCVARLRKQHLLLRNVREGI